jgi:hypothetical protein
MGEAIVMNGCHLGMSDKVVIIGRLVGSTGSVRRSDLRALCGKGYRVTPSGEHVNVVSEAFRGFIRDLAALELISRDGDKVIVLDVDGLCRYGAEILLSSDG